MNHRRHGTPSELFSLIPDDEPFREDRERTAEEDALHVVHIGRRALDESGRRYDDGGVEPAAVPHYRYDDEEPEVDDPDRWQRDDDETPDCEELLLVQHYAFDDAEIEEREIDERAMDERAADERAPSSRPR